MNEPRAQRLRILHCAPHLSRGGAERQLDYLATDQAQRGHDVHVAYIDAGLQPTLLDRAGVACHRLGVAGSYDPRLLWRVYRLIRALEPDVVQSWVLQMDVLSGLACTAGGASWVLREPASEEHYRGWKANLRRLLARRASAIVANSSSGAAYWTTHDAVPPVRLVHNALPFERLDAVPAQPSAVGADDRVPFLLFAGRLEPQKNLETLLEALALVVPDTGVRALWCGEGFLRERLALRARELGIASHVKFLGQQPAETVWGLMKSAAALTFVSRYEGLPNVVMEAMACRCPLVLSDIPSHRELFPDGEFVDGNDPAAIARSIRGVLADPEGSRKRAERARQRADTWTIARMADAYEEVYRSVIATHGI